MKVERWVGDTVPGAAYDRLRRQLDRADALLRQIRDGKHSLPGTLVQIDRYFDAHGKDLDSGNG